MLEYTLTGQTEYNIYKSEIADFDAVIDKLKINLLKDKVRKYLFNKFKMSLKRPVIIDLYSGTEFNWKGIITELRGDLGRYYYQNYGKMGIVHMIYIKKGLNKKRFMSILAHEMAHAYLREYQIMERNRYLREGFARWIEYQCLLDLGERKKADKISKIIPLKDGREIRKFLKMEKEAGIEGVMNFLDKIK